MTDEELKALITSYCEKEDQALKAQKIHEDLNKGAQDLYTEIVREAFNRGTESEELFLWHIREQNKAAMVNVMGIPESMIDTKSDHSTLSILKVGDVIRRPRTGEL